MPKFTEVKKQVLECLLEGCVLHESRNDINVKNLLEVGAVSGEEVAEIIRRTRGNNYESSPHHMDQSINVHVIKTRHQGVKWYIKWYFIEPDAVFISVYQ